MKKLIDVAVCAKSSKAAMFGLDVRITLIIFVAIAMVVYSASYSIITQSKGVELVSSIKSVEAAYKNFVMDTRYDLSENTNPYFYNISELINLTQDSSKPYTLKYKGPYIEYDLDASSAYIKHPVLGNKVAMVSRSYNGAWAASDKTQKCSASDCYKWIVFYGVDKEITKEIGIQNGDSDFTSKSKIRRESNGTNYDIFYAVQPE